MTDPKEPQYENVQGEIIDERTGETIPKGANSLILSSNQNTQIEISKVGTLELTPQAEEVLGEKLDPRDVKIRPDGLVYLPWTYYANKLNQAFGRLQWGLLPQGAPHVKPQGEYGDVLVVWGHWLAIKGVPVSFAYGETTYRPDNATMSYGDACEGAKSISLARCCKQLGIALELWDADWITNWKNEYAESYPNPKQSARQKKLWRKKGAGTVQMKPAVATKPASRPNPEKAYSTKSSQEGTGATQGKNTGNGASEQPGASGAVSAAQELADTYTGNQILGSKDGVLVKELMSLTGKTSAEVCGYVAKLEKSKKFSIGQIVKALKPEEA